MPRWNSTAKNKQRLLIEQQRPWQKSTGPRSEYGRLVSSRNALKKKCSFLTDVSSMSQQVEGDIDQPLKIGDRVCYIGNFQPTFDSCAGQPLTVVGFDEAAGAIACCTTREKLIWFYPQDLERV